MDQQDENNMSTQDRRDIITMNGQYSDLKYGNPQ